MSSYKINGPIPTVDSHIEALADYFEIQALCAQNNEISAKDILKKLMKPADEPSDEAGIEDLEDKINTKLEPVIDAIQRRITNSRGNYPFTLEVNGNVVAFRGFNDFTAYLYVYLLFATRLNMNANASFQNIDGTKLFELISAEVAKTYFGDRSSALVFGTALDGGFDAKVNDLCEKLNEGTSFVNHGGGEVTENDDALDIVVWKSFEDQVANKLIGFGQCKTGTSYEGQRKDLQPKDFCKKWIKTPINQEPIRMFFIADVMEVAKFWKRSLDAGILFDRVRIMDYLPNLDDDLQQNITQWSSDALQFANN
ncbi:hypothetical protein [Daejeonella sp.]|uniref:hypothetical protein n=1 Tax=Daejeonella sp. TaxID=2805397 RepID=UPI0030BF8000